MQGDRLLAELRTVLRCEPEAGEFTWLVARGNVRAGDRAGTQSLGYRKIAYTDSEGVQHQFWAHRLTWWFRTGVLPKEIDHIDRNRANTAWSNLREIKRSRNHFNAGLMCTNTSGKTGVNWDASEGKWRARIMVDGRRRSLGLFDSYEEAVAARRAAEVEYLGATNPA